MIDLDQYAARLQRGVGESNSLFLVCMAQLALIVLMLFLISGGDVPIHLYFIGSRNP
jgi:hypothetical protein